MPKRDIRGKDDGKKIGVYDTDTNEIEIRVGDNLYSVSVDDLRVSADKRPLPAKVVKLKREFIRGDIPNFVRKRYSAE